MSQLEMLRTNLARGGAHLGDLIWWTLADARIDRTTLERIWSLAGLDSGHLPAPPSAEKTLKAAAREAALGQRDWLIRSARMTRRRSSSPSCARPAMAMDP
jgi:hypothetical protein